MSEQISAHPRFFSLICGEPAVTETAKHAATDTTNTQDTAAAHNHSIFCIIRIHYVYDHFLLYAYPPPHLSSVVYVIIRSPFT